MRNRSFIHPVLVLSGVAIMAAIAVGAPTKVATLSPEAQKVSDEYSALLADLQNALKPQLPQLDPSLIDVFAKAHEAEKGNLKNGKDKNGNKTTTFAPSQYGDFKAADASMAAATPLLQQVDAFLSNDALDDRLVKCAVLADATPRGLAEFAQLAPQNKALIDALLADPKLMKEMLYAGGAKGGRYGQAMQVLRSIQAASPRAATGHFQRLALATSLELAATDNPQYSEIDPVKRYQFFEQSYLDGELDPHFDKLTTWQYRQVINDPHTEAEMKWVREMLWNYRPDHITAPEGYRSRYVGLMDSEFGHTSPTWDEDSELSQMQQTINKGSLCGPKAFFGRCLGRSFGVPVWGARLRSHTAMSYWTPKGWTTILGVAWHSGFWSADVEPMRASVFKLIAMSREYPDEYIKVSRAQWAGSVLGEDRISGIDSGSGGVWNALALNKMRLVVSEKNPSEKSNTPPWVTDSYAKDDPKHPEQMMKAQLTDADRKISVDSAGAITIPAVACASPTGNTDKILFMKGRDGAWQLHYKRWEMPEPFTYEITVERAGNYSLSADVVTVNEAQFFLVTVNDAKDPVRLEMPYTVGRWGQSPSVVVSLVQGKNTLSFTRTVPADFIKEGYKYSGPEYGGITVKTFTLKPAAPK